MTIDRPIFILGSGRSGTTILYDLLSMQSELCWISNISLRLPFLPCAPVSQRVLDWGGFGANQKKKVIGRASGSLHVTPVEAKALYDWIGLRRDKRSDATDCTDQMAARFRKVVERHQFWSGRNRFISKETSNNQRYRLLDHIFPNALYVHTIRDGRAVANSINKKDWMSVIDLWWTGDNAIHHANDYDDPIQLIGEHWRRNVDELLGAKELFGDRYLELRYEDLTRDVHGEVAKILDFAGLRKDPEYFKILPATLPDMNEKWRTDLSAENIAFLEKQIGPALRKLGYPA
jgi:hypothetical protein